MSVFVFIGRDGIGKTTVSKLLASHLGRPWVKFPYGSDGDTEYPVYTGIEIRKILNDTEHPCNPVAFQALQFVNKIDGIRAIRRLLVKHGTVFVDRWWSCAYAYGLADGLDEKWLTDMNDLLDTMLKATAIFYLVGESHRSGDNDIYSCSDKQLLIEQYYEKYYENEVKKGTNIIKIDTTGKDENQVALEVLGHITNMYIQR